MHPYSGTARHTGYSRLTGAVYLRWTEGKPRTLIALCVSITAGPVAHSVREDGLDASPLVLGELDLVIPRIERLQLTGHDSVRDRSPCDRATRTFDVGRGRLRVFLDVFNLYNRQNLRSFDYKVALPEGTVIPNIGETLLPLLPTLGFTWEF